MATRRTTKRSDRSSPTAATPRAEEREQELEEDRTRLNPDAEEDTDTDRESAESETDSEDEAELPPAEELPPGDLEEFDEDAHAPDDALGLYLRQMGAIPLLSRDQELRLAMRLEYRRERYRHAAMSCWRVLAKVADTFQRVLDQHLALDPTIDVVNTLKLSRENILRRMPHNVPTLKGVIKQADDVFCQLQRASSNAARHRLRKELYRKLKSARRLAEEMSPRIDLLDLWTDELRVILDQMNVLAEQAE